MVCDLDKIDVESLNNDCYFHKLIKDYYELQRKIHAATGDERRILKEYLAKLTPKVHKALDIAQCYPEYCDTCPGLRKCLNCKFHDICQGH